MSSINLHTREINIKVVYYGPGLGGKTSSLQHVHRGLQQDLRGQLVSLATGVDRTLYFDFLPVKLPKVKDYTIRMSLYTVPGQVHYNATRKLVLQGCDGVVFVADSQTARQEANVESLQNLEDNLRGHGINPESIPLVLQYNKRDLPNVMPVELLEKELNHRKVKQYETCALTGQGVFDALRTITKMVLNDLKKRGIYQDSPGKDEKRPNRVVVSPMVEEGLVKNLDSLMVPPVQDPVAPAPGPEGRALTYSLIWAPGTGREYVLAMEGDIERGDYLSAVKRSEGMLLETVGKSECGSTEPTVAEALLMLGVLGVYFKRFCAIQDKSEPTREEALFCHFFLTDVEFRLRAVSQAAKPSTMEPG